MLKNIFRKNTWKKNSLTVFFLIYIYAGYAQQLFTAYQVRVKVEYSTPGKNVWMKLHEGEKIPDNATLKIQGGGSVVLYGDQIIEKRLPETPSSAEIIIPLKQIIFEKPVIEEGSILGAIKAMFRHLLVHDEPMDKPAIHKGDRIENPMLFPADGEVLISSDFLFHWSKDSRTNYYFLLKEKNASGKWMCLNEIITDTVLSPTNKNACPDITSFKTNVTYRWKIALPNSTASKGWYNDFSFADTALKDSVSALITDIEKTTAADDRETPLLLKATCYEKYNMFTEANTVYISAMKQYPSSKLIKDMHTKFILRIIKRNQPAQ